jgi:UDPglucose 6-dehydrogenase
MVIVAVGTPQADDGRVDLRSLDGAVASLREFAPPGTVVVIKSTVPPGTAVRVRTQLAGREGVSVVSCPEFLREGSALHDVHHAARVVIGGDDPAAVARVRRLLEVPSAEVVLCDNMSA